MTHRRDKLLIFYWKPGPQGGPVLRVDVRMVVYFVLLLLVLGLAGWLYLTRITEVAEYAYEVRELERRREELRREITILRAEMARLGSLERILQEGRMRGYRLPSAADPSSQIVIEVAVPLETPTPIHTGTATDQEMSPWEKRLTDWFRKGEPTGSEADPDLGKGP